MSVKSTTTANPLFLGETIRLSALGVVDDSGTSITAPTAISLAIVRPDGTTYATVTQATITNDGSGNYHYDFLMPANEQFGLWQAKWTFTNGAYVGEFALPFSVSQFNALQS